MGWDVLIWGSLKFPSGKRSDWLNTIVNGSTWSDWKLWFKNEIEGEPRPVEQHLSEWKQLSAKNKHALDIEIDDSGVKVLGLLPKEEFVYRAQQYVAVFRSAELVGAKGEMMFVGVASPLTYRLRLSGPRRRSKFEVLNIDLESSPDVRKILAAIPRAPSKPGVNPSERKVAFANALELSPDAMDAIEEIHVRLDKASDEALLKAASSNEWHIRDSGTWKSTKTDFPDARALRAGLLIDSNRSPEELASRHRAAIGLLVSINRSRAIPLAMRLAAKDVHSQVRWGAFNALVGANEKEVIDLAFSAVEESYGKLPRGFDGAISPRGPAMRVLIATGSSNYSPTKRSTSRPGPRATTCEPRPKSKTGKDSCSRCSTRSEGCTIDLRGSESSASPRVIALAE
jgi:hypothetical protein